MCSSVGPNTQASLLDLAGQSARLATERTQKASESRARAHHLIESKHTSHKALAQDSLDIHCLSVCTKLFTES